ncbi:MAG: HAD-IIA family hydrolase [Actinomycetes bacterium]
MTATPTVVIDLDGVVWLAGEAIAGGGEAIALLRSAGFPILFVTNNSSPTIATLVDRLAQVGIETHPDEIITASSAAAHAAPEGCSALVIGESGLFEAAERRGLRNERHKPDVVLLGWSRVFDFEVVAEAAHAVRHGAQFIATNDDPTHPTPTGLLPGTGALVAAVAVASETQPLIAGKPGQPIVDLIAERSDSVSLVIGDRPSTDGLLADRVGATFGLVTSAATPPGSASATLNGANLLDVVQTALHGVLAS